MTKTRVIDKQHKTHPSYGVIEMTRVGGYSPDLVGSVSGVHSTAIRLTVSHGRRSNGNDDEHWSADGPPISEIEMSMLQWAELITLSGMGVLVPCTLKVLDGRLIPDAPQHDSKIGRVIEESRVELFDGPDPNDSAMAELTHLRAEISALKVSKAVKDGLQQRLSNAAGALRGPGVVAHVAVERLGKHLAAAAAEARIESRVQGVPTAAQAIDTVASTFVLAAPEVER